MKNSASIGTVILLCGLANLALGATAAHSPAGFGAGDRQLDKLIVFPDISENMDKEFLCQGILKSNGKMAQRACYLVQPRDRPYLAAIEKAAKKSRFRPATLNGKKISVYFQYRVRFTRKDDDQFITLYANQGYPENVSAYGEEHVAAQRGVSRELWEQACPNRRHFVVLARAHVDEDGTISSINVTHGSGLQISNNCEQSIVATLEKSVFVPAYADGEPVPSSYLEAFGN